MNTSSKLAHFVPLASWLHCMMALGLLAMLFIGAGMVASVSERHEWLIHLHKPLGIAFVQVAAALYHGLIRRDGVLQSMARGAGKN